MTLNDGFRHFLESETYKTISLKRDSEGGKMRLYASRFKNGKLTLDTMIEVLSQYGYKVKDIEVIPPKKKKK
jgi:hypothetical protein